MWTQSDIRISLIDFGISLSETENYEERSVLPNGTQVARPLSASPPGDEMQR
jgi:hypothetical protein